MNRFLFNRFANKFDNIVRNIPISSIRQTTKWTPQYIKFNIQTPVIYQFATFLKQFQRFHSTHAPININPSSIKSDVIIYKYDNPRFFKIINTFGIVQFFVLCYTSESLLHGLQRTKKDEEDDPKLEKIPSYLRKDFSENKWRYGLSFGTFLIGMLSLIYIDCIRNLIVFNYAPCNRMGFDWCLLGLYIEKRSLFGVASRWQ